MGTIIILITVFYLSNQIYKKIKILADKVENLTDEIWQSKYTKSGG